MRTHARLASALLAASLVLAAPLAGAQTDADRATARELGQDGQAALEKKDYKTAEDKYHRADSLFHAPTLLLGYARAEAGLGKVVNAVESYNRIIREGVAPGAPKVFADAVEAAKAEVGAVQARVASVTITITGPDDPKVTLDDVTVPSAALGVKRPIDPGSHVVKATADGWEPSQTSFTVADAGSSAASIAMKKSTAAVVAPVTGPVGTPATIPAGAQSSPASGADTGTGSNGSTQRTLGIVGLIAGGVGLGVGAVTGVLALGKHSTLAGECSTSACPPKYSSDVDSFHSMASISTIGFIAGGVLAAGGAVLFFTAPHGSSAPPPATAGLHVTPVLGFGTVGAVGTF